MVTAMEGVIKRKPINIPNYRRTEYNPEFLDIDRLLVKYTPLIKSIHRYFCSYSGILDQPADMEDLYNQIQIEFVRLVKTYDPRRGVDFPGYIKFKLRHRVYYYVTKLQNTQKTEMTVLKTDDPNSISEFNYLPEYLEQADENYEDKIFRIEAIASINWKALSLEDRELVIDVLNHKSLEDIAKSKSRSLEEITNHFERICEMLRKHYYETE